MPPPNGPILIPPRYATPLRGAAPLPGDPGQAAHGENLEVLTQAHAAYMGLKRNAAAIRGRGANIFTQWVGDPDALGSAVLLRAILRTSGPRRSGS